MNLKVLSNEYLLKCQAHHIDRLEENREYLKKQIELLKEVEQDILLGSEFIKILNDEVDDRGLKND